MITSLQALRFIFALFIFAEHFPISPEAPHLLQGAGPMGVSFFLVLSGFVMSIGYEARPQSPSFRWGDFLIKRLIRLWPLHLLCLGAWILLAWGAWGAEAIHPWPLLANALLLQWLPIEHIGGNSVAWCLSVLVFCYALYPLLARARTQALLLVVVALGGLLALCSSIPPPDYTSWYWYISPASRLIDFLLGILTYRLYSQVVAQGGQPRWRELPAIGRLLLELLPLALYALALLQLRAHPSPIGSVALFYLPSCLVIFVFALSQSANTKQVPALLARPWLIYLGQISFSFYMLHNLVILTVKRAMEVLSPTAPWEIRLLVSLVATLAASMLVNRYFEAPLAEALTQRLSHPPKPHTSNTRLP